MSIAYEIRIRDRNQVTLPDGLVKLLGVKPGDRLVAEPDPETSGELKIRVIRRSYAGVLHGAWGATEAEIAAYLKGEQDSWGQ
jgi:bifunctional DNA-binding transcriptional regulator/antitoxin component of YhaV-PrlF toxin-antitoxin module